MVRIWFACICVISFLRLVDVRESSPPISSPCFAYVDLLSQRSGYVFTEIHVNWSVTWADRLGPEILTVFEIKRQVLHRVRLHVKVPGWLSDLNALLTKKLPKFLSRLNEMSGSFGIIAENFEVF